MKLSTSLVAVKKITATSSRLDFESEQIERLAEQILRAEGIISPLIVRRTSLQSYEIVSGYFEYHAAVRAREIDPRKGEMIAVYIIEPDDERMSEAITEQIKLLHRSGELDNIYSPIPSTDILTPAINSQELNQDLKIIKDLERQFTSVEKALMNELSNQSLNMQRLEIKLDSLTNSLVSLLDNKVEEYLNKLNNLSLVDIPKAATSQPTKVKSTKKQAKVNESDYVLNDLNNLAFDELFQKMLRLGYAESNAVIITNDIIQKRSLYTFTSISDVRKHVKGFNKPKKIDDLCNLWK
ncbi:ParB N-terminal domain-containing protein [Pseudanabaena biceps]|nr:ParB N-terminal domain-containing protein [Pseudanabaena biceps]